MKPAAFAYCCPDSVDEAIALLAANAGTAKLMAGGQSLVPMLNFRVLRPALIVDISRLLELDYVRERADGVLVIGALSRHRVLETSSVVARLFPIVPAAMRHVAHLAIRNRGTIGGSLSHADPAAELPMLARLLDAAVVVRSVRGERSVSAADFFVGPLTTALAEDELLVRVEIPALSHNAWAFEEFARRPGDFAVAAAGVVLDIADGRVRTARVAMTGIGDTPVRCAAVETALLERSPSDDLIDTVVPAACEALEPRDDVHASAEFRRHLAGVLMARTLRRARDTTIGATT
jgi:CO/xanthine dehydrogenase FAD-binding subunit